MKLKFLLFSVFLLFLNSCEDPGGEQIYEGFTFDVVNNTNKTYNAQLFIGGFKDGSFITTESVMLENINTGSQGNSSYYIDENRWQPNLEAIRNIPSEHCAFKLKLSEDREEVIKNINGLDNLALVIPESVNFTGGQGVIYVYIYDDKITARQSKL